MLSLKSRHTKCTLSNKSVKLFWYQNTLQNIVFIFTLLQSNKFLNTLLLIWSSSLEQNFKIFEMVVHIQVAIKMLSWCQKQSPAFLTRYKWAAINSIPFYLWQQNNLKSVSMSHYYFSFFHLKRIIGVPGDQYKIIS